MGNNPHAAADVWRPRMVSTHHERRDGVAFRLQVTEHPVSAASAEPRDILSEHPGRSACPNNPQELRPQPTRIRLATPLAGEGDGLAWESPGDEVNGGGIEGSDVIMSWDSRPVLLQDAPAERIKLHLPRARHAGALEARVHAANAGEQRAEDHRSTVHSASPSRSRAQPNRQAQRTIAGAR